LAKKLPQLGIDNASLIAVVLKHVSENDSTFKVEIIDDQRKIYFSDKDRTRGDSGNQSPHTLHHGSIELNDDKTVTITFHLSASDTTITIVINEAGEIQTTNLSKNKHSQTPQRNF